MLNQNTARSHKEARPCVKPGRGRLPATSEKNSPAGPAEAMQSCRILATVKTYGQLVAVMRARNDELEITREVMDERAHLPSGYSAKLLAQIKNFGPSSLGAMLGVLGLALIVVEDRKD